MFKPFRELLIMDFVYLLHEGNQLIGVESEQHICGLFPRAEWLGLLREVGFESDIIPDPFERELFLAHKPKG